MPRTQPNGCTTECCVGFRMNNSPEELADLGVPLAQWDVPYIPSSDRPVLAEMVIPRGRDGQSYVYDCKHQAPNGDCGLWGDPRRPLMCQVYPNGSDCRFCGMTDTEVRSGR